MKAYTAHYTLRDGRTGVLEVLAACSCDAVLVVAEHAARHGLDMAKCRVRPGPR